MGNMNMFNVYVEFSLMLISSKKWNVLGYNYNYYTTVSVWIWLTTSVYWRTAFDVRVFKVV